MNIFHEYRGIVGRTDIASLKQTMDEFFELSNTIRQRLGKQGYLLDKYISLLLQAANVTLAFDAADSGLRTVGELHSICHSALDGSERFRDHPFYEHAKAYIDAHPLDFQEDRTKTSLYVIALFHDYMEYATGKFFKEQKRAMREVCDIVELRDLYQRISSLLSDENPMEKLNLLIRKSFILSSPMQSFIQGMTDELLFALTSRDDETGNLMSQLI